MNTSLPDDGTPLVAEQTTLSSTDEPTEPIKVALALYEELVDLHLQLNDADVNNSMHCPKIRRAGEMHLEKAKSLYCRVKQEAIKIKHRVNSDGTNSKGIKNISKSIGEPAAKPLLFVKRDRDTEDGGKKGEITTNPKEVDAIVKRAWKSIYDGVGTKLKRPLACSSNTSQPACTMQPSSKSKTSTEMRSSISFGTSPNPLEPWTDGNRENLPTSPGMCANTSPPCSTKLNKAGPGPNLLDMPELSSWKKLGLRLGKL